MKKLFLTIMAVAALALSATPQALKSGFENLSKQKYDDAAKVFAKALEKSNETMAANYGMGCVICAPQYKGYNALKGFRMIRNANDRYNASSPKTKNTCKNIYGFGYDEIHAKMLAVAQEQLDKVKAENNNIDGYQWFIDNFDGAEPQVAEARELQAELVWITTSKAGTFQAYKDFYDKYPNTKHADQARTNYEQQWKKICDDFYSEGEITQMATFAQQYPNYPFYTEANKQAYAIAQAADKLKLAMPYSSEYEPYYKEFVNKAAPYQQAYVALQRIILPYLEWGRYKEAADILSQYAPKFPDQKEGILRIAAMLRAPGNKYKTTALPKTINTDHLEYAPVITPDGKTLYFCGTDRPDNIGNEDIFVAEYSGGTWQQAKSFDQFNTPFGNEAPLAVSPDGNMLLIYKDANIYYTERTRNGWKDLKKMTVLNTGKSWEADASFAPDGSAIFFISDRLGNIGRYHPHETYFHGSYHGNSDIYVSTRNADGSWNEPINIGSTINTPYAERSPWLASDMKTLYFSSDGHCGMGKLDVFKSTRLSDTSWTQWSEPINLGKEINTAHDDYNYLISTDGKSAIFTKVSSGNVDICTVDIPEKMRPEAIGIVFGKVIDNTRHPLAATIKWEDLETGKILGTLQCNPQAGTYFITLPAGKKYGYFVEMDGYYPVSGHINTEGLTNGKDIERNITMNSIEEILQGKVAIVLENIFFDTNKYQLRAESFPELARLAAFIRSNPTAVLEISGHTDNSGSADANRTLSQRRADSVKDHLINLGCPSANIISKGYGADKPIADNATEQGKAKNRRVEFKIQ
ncbi:MAG: OmpA family protein [Bacteroidales bacterium]|nr:OmpA family protein [Bacteroidales bacterium]